MPPRVLASGPKPCGVNNSCQVKVVVYVIHSQACFGLQSGIYPSLLNITAKLKVISIRMSTMLDEKFTLIIYNRLVALWSASVTVLLMYNASIFS